MNCSLYKQEKIDGSNSGVKWSCPNIHDLMTILEKIPVDNILENVFDKRLSSLDKLSIVQLREECQNNNLQTTGSKMVLVKRLQMVLGQDAKVICAKYCIVFKFGTM